MGVNFRDLVEAHPVSFDDLSGKTIAIDGYNMLYQFLSTIRARDGSLLTDSKGNVTSHLVGLFARTTNLMQKNIKLIFVFDGAPPKLKHKELARRKEVKLEAQRKYEVALEKEDVVGMQKYAARTSRLTKDMVEEAKKLVSALGLPFIQAPSEGEAQAAHVARKGDCYAVASQDYDSLLYESPRVIRNFSVEGRRKIPGKFAWGKVEPSCIDYAALLKNFGLTCDKLLWLAILVGTDYNPAGVRGIGPKKGLALVKKAAKPEDIFSDHELADDVDWREVLDTFKKMPVTDDYKLEWTAVDRKAVERVLVDGHDFSVERVDKALGAIAPPKHQKGLGDFL